MYLHADSGALSRTKTAANVLHESDARPAVPAFRPHRDERVAADRSALMPYTVSG